MLEPSLSHSLRTRLLPALVAVAVSCSVLFSAPAPDPIQQAVDKGCEWLAKNQNPDGGYGPYAENRVKNTSDVGITAFVVYSFAKNSRQYKAPHGPFISKAVEFLLARQQSDGGFYDTKDPALQNYRTCVVLLALRTLDPEKYSGAIRRAQEYIRGLQLTEVKGFEESKHVTYGAITYGDGLKADLSNTQYAAEALYASGLSGSDELWRRLAVFVSRCQNAEKIDPILGQLNVGTTRDGGFRYAPADTRGPSETLDDGTKVFSSYGSMTYAGLKSLLYAQVDKEDVRVKQAFAWITKNFTVRENPGMATKQNPAAGQQGLFYYYQTMAKALAVYDQPIIKDAKGVEHNWARELSDHLISLQKPDGSWKGENERWWENIPALDTAYAIIALTDCQAVLEKMPKAPPAPPAASPAPGSMK